MGAEGGASQDRMSAPGNRIVIRLMDGLGNQLFQYALGRKLAALHGTEPVFDTIWYRSGAKLTHPRPLALREFAIRGRVAEEDEEFRDYWLRPTPLGRLWWKVEQRLLPLRWRRFVEQDPQTFARRGRMFEPEVLRVSPGTYLSGWWISPRYFEGIEHELRNELVLREPLPPRAAEWARDMGAGESVAVHVRRGDFLNHPEIGVLGAAYYARAVEQLRSQRTNLRFFVFSDDLPAAKELLAEVLPAFEAIEPPPGTSPAVDLALMSHCRHFITANSTFSWWGAWLGSHPDKIVLVPEHWYQGARVALPDVYPEEWIKVAD